MIGYLSRWYECHQEEIRRFGRFLITGGWNTVFGVAVYTLLYQWLHERVNYLVIMIPSSILAITNAYIGYKVFVFRTKGHIIREYFRFYAVYGVSTGLNFLFMFLLVSGLKIHPLISQFFGIALTTVCSYVGHRWFSFRHHPAEKKS